MSERNSSRNGGESQFARLSFALVVVVAWLPVGLLSQSALRADERKIGWEAVPALVARIQPPRFADREFTITSFGAMGDGKTDCKSALDKAIATCCKRGGGRVVVPAGDWFVRGPIHLKSSVNLVIAKGATLRFSTDPADYLPVVRTRFEGNELMGYSPLIYACDQSDIAITGEGIVDGQASQKNWWEWKASGSKDSSALRRLGDRNTPLDERVFGEGHRLRPSFVEFYRCRGILIQGVTFINSPMWMLHPVLCGNVTVLGVTLSSHGPNNDGCNPESCRDVLIDNCTFDNGDDCIAIKSGRGGDGRRIGVPSENIFIRNCQMKDGHGGVVLGSEMSGGVRNVFVEDCVMGSPNLIRAIRLKSNSSRGGFLENLFVRNIQVAQVEEAVVRINLQYEKDRGQHYPTVRNIELKNVTSERSGRPFYFVGLPEAKITNVLVENCTFKNASQPSVFEYTDDVRLKNVRMLPSKGFDDD